MKNYFRFFFARLCLLFFTHRYDYKFTSTVERCFRVIHKSLARSLIIFKVSDLRTGEAMLPTVIMIITKRSKLFFKDWYFQSNYTSPETLKKKMINKNRLAPLWLLKKGHFTFLSKIFFKVSKKHVKRLSYFTLSITICRRYEN